MPKRSKLVGTKKDHLEIIYQTAPMGIALLDADTAFITCNPALLRKLGYTHEELPELDLLSICHPWDRNKVQTLVKAAQQQDESYLRDEVRLAHKDGIFFWTEVSVQHIPKALNRPESFVVMIQNIQKRKEIQLELMELRRRLLENSEKERKALAQNLHDGPMQELHSINFQIAGMLDHVPEETVEQLKMIQKTVRGINNDLRVISYDLRPAALSKFGLARSIKTHADEFAVKHPELNFKLELTPDGNVIAEEIRLTLYRIYQQSLGNIIRHANATEVSIRLDLDGDHVTLEVIDNGKGFQVPDRWVSLVRAGHYGLAGTSDRVDALGGKFRVISKPDEGTRVWVQIPDYMEA